MATTVASMHNIQPVLTENDKEMTDESIDYSASKRFEADPTTMTMNTEVFKTPEQPKDEYLQTISLNGHRIVATRHAADSHEFTLAA